MCDPVSLTTAALGAATSIGGTMLQNSGTAAASRASLAATRAEAARQSELQNRQFAQVDQARAGYDPNGALGASQADATARRQAAYGQATAVPGSQGDATVAGMPVGEYLPGQGGAPDVVRAAVDQARARNENVLGGEVASKAALEGWGDALLGGRIGANRAAQNINLLGSFQRGSAAALQPELAAAQSVGQGQRTLGSLITGLTPVVTAGASSVLNGQGALGRLFSANGGLKSGFVGG